MAAHALARTVPMEKFDYVASSPLRRAAWLGALLARRIGVTLKVTHYWSNVISAFGREKLGMQFGPLRAQLWMAFSTLLIVFVRAVAKRRQSWADAL